MNFKTAVHRGVFIALIVFLSSQLPISAQSQKLSPAQIKQDLSMLRDTLRKVYPSLYRYRSKPMMDHIFDSCFRAVHDSMAVTRFYSTTSFIIAALGDGHANCRLPSQVQTGFLNDTKILPAMISFIHNRAFVYCCKQNPSLNASEIIAINGRPMSEIVRRMFQHIQSDAFIESHKNWELPENFHLLYNILYGYTDKFEIEYRDKTGELGKTTLNADVLKNFMCDAPFTRPKKYLQLKYEANAIAVLSIKSFFDGFLQQTGENFGRFLDSAFADIKAKGTKKLLIDIRRNQGGNDGNGELLYSYLTSKPFMYYRSQETKTEKFSESGHPNLGLQQPQKNSYNGKLYVLQDGRSFSASAEFAAIVKTNNRGKFIGEDCGGGYYGNTSGDDITVELPNSHISVRIPLVKYSMAVTDLGAQGNAIHADYPIYVNIGDLINKTDTQLEEAIKLAGIH